MIPAPLLEMRGIEENLRPTAYRYIGPAGLAASAIDPPQRIHVQQPQDVLRWIKETGQRLCAGRTVTATFVVETGGRLWIADRHSEHVQCARGQDVLSAGEMTFLVDKQGVTVKEVTNQSTGYCPEPESWDAVAAALDTAQIPHPGRFTTGFLFRRCEVCGMTNIVKEDIFECGVCRGALPRQWNFNSASEE